MTSIKMFFFGDAVCRAKQIAVVNWGFTLFKIDIFLPTNEIRAKVQLLERFLLDKTVSKMGNNVETVEHRVQKAILILTDNFLHCEDRIIIWVKTSYVGPSVAVDAAQLYCEDRLETTDSCENVSNRNNIYCEPNRNNETRGKITGNVCDFPEPKETFRQSHTHLKVTELFNTERRIWTLWKLQKKNEMANCYNWEIQM